MTAEVEAGPELDAEVAEQIMSSAVWILWTEGGQPLGVYNSPRIPKAAAPLGMEWEYVRGRISFWRGTCGGTERGCVLHDIAIHRTWYLQRFEVKS